jgi:hypothetical protein
MRTNPRVVGRVEGENPRLGAPRGPKSAGSAAAWLLPTAAAIIWASAATIWASAIPNPFTPFIKQVDGEEHRE